MTVEEFWKDKEFKSWVVQLESGNKRKKRTHRTDIKYVRAKGKYGAIRTAIHHSFLPGKVRCLSIRLMGPQDAYRVT